MQWLNQNASAIGAITSTLTLLIWLFYAQLLYNGYIRQRRPRIIINRGHGKDLDSLCLISNMSAEAIFVEHIIAVLDTDSGERQLDITDYQQPGEEDRSTRTYQGPLPSGAYLHVGAFRGILDRVAHHHGVMPPDHRPGQDWGQNATPRAIEIRVIAIYGSEDAPIGARRRFCLTDDGHDCLLTPDGLDTQRLTSRRHRHRIRHWMREL
ncbi:hypothetical protein [Halomonas borealis]|uniref:hypothetical protein n=1 Tax=Halomonas borealis TaxID=2508710 RepID=UPI00109F6E1A|nr:hypothetical protein [Halomonas borealis]